MINVVVETDMSRQVHLEELPRMMMTPSTNRDQLWNVCSKFKRFRVYKYQLRDWGDSLITFRSTRYRSDRGRMGDDVSCPMGIKGEHVTGKNAKVK